jgi:hypothetical protein
MRSDPDEIGPAVDERYMHAPTVDAFQAAELTAGRRDSNAPGLRPRDHPGYYAAYVLDPDGNNIEAVYHGCHPQGF